jgi:predicted Zn-dependent peptidase
MRTTNALRRSAAALLLALGASPLPAQVVTKDPAPRPASAGTLDRAVQPKPAAAPVLRVPTWTTATLSNGAQLVVAEKHDLPLVSFSISFVGGTANYEPADKVGVGAFTASMLSEGTASMTGEQLSDAQQLLGTSIGVGVGSETGSIGFTSLKGKFEPALALVADMLENPSFPAEALERIRGRTLVSLTQARDNPNAIAGNVFSKVLYGDAHPYGRVLTEAAAKAITRDDIVAFHKAYFQPGRAIITVAGDVSPAAARAAVEKAFAKWPAGGSRPTFDYPAPPPLKARTIYLVDKPKAAQSVFAFGTPGPTRATPDYYALQVMNMVMGGLFQSRLNHNIREVKGYSYGVNSGFAFGRGPGAFRAGGGIVTEKTDSALIEFVKELKGVRGDVPFTDDEIEQGKAALVQSLPQRFSSVNAMGGSIASLYTQDLPESFYRDYAAKVNAVTREDLVRVAQKYVDLDHLDLVIVGDRAVIEAPLKATGIAPIVVLDVDAKTVTVP